MMLVHNSLQWLPQWYLMNTKSGLIFSLLGDMIGTAAYLFLYGIHKVLDIKDQRDICDKSTIPFAQTLTWATQFKIISNKKYRLINQSQLSKNLHACLTKQYVRQSTKLKATKKTQDTYLMATTVRSSALLKVVMTSSKLNTKRFTVQSISRFLD